MAEAHASVAGQAATESPTLLMPLCSRGSMTGIGIDSEAEVDAASGCAGGIVRAVLRALVRGPSRRPPMRWDLAGLVLSCRCRTPQVRLAPPLTAPVPYLNRPAL